MARFKVVTGMYVQDGKTYHKSDVVESDLDLIKLFPQKFTPVAARLGAPEEAAPPSAPQKKAPAAGDNDEEDEPKHRGPVTTAKKK